MNELEQCKNTLRSALMFIQGYGNRDKVLADIAAILNPVEYEEVEEIVGWVNVYRRENGRYYTGDFHREQEDADENADEGRISCQPIRVTVKREKKRPVERSVSGQVRWEMDDRRLVIPYASDSSFGLRDLDGKTGTLTFTWTEDPTT